MDAFFEKIKIRKLILVVILMLIFSVLFSSIIEGITKLPLNKQMVSLFNSIGMIIWFLYEFKKENLSIKEKIQDYKIKANYKEMSYVLILNIVLSLASVLLVSFIIFKLNPGLLKELMEEEPVATNAGRVAFVCDTLNCIFIAPLLEELIFRGVILNRLKLKWSATSAVIVTSILFGSLHAGLFIVGATFFGIMMCLLYMKTKNIFITMSVHFVNNLLVSLLQIIPSGSEEAARDILDITMFESNYKGISCGVVFAIALFFTMKYIIKNWPNRKEYEVTNDFCK